MLMVEAFSPRGPADLPKYAPMLGPAGLEEEAAFEAWDKAVGEPFRERFDFC
jgi:hypothetical protein